MRWVVLPCLVVGLCFGIRELFTVSVMGLQQQFPFGPALVLVGFFLGLGPGFVMLLLSGITVWLWGTTPGPQYPFAVPINMSLAIPVLFVTAWIRTLMDNERIQREALSDFVAVIAHEVRTPLSTISVATDNAVHYFDYRLPEDSARNMLVACERIENVISKAIEADLSEITAFTAQPEAFSLKPFLEQRIAMTAAPDRIQLQSPDSRVITDPYLFGTVISNLLDNAIKYALTDTDIQLTAHTGSRRGRQGLVIDCENRIDPDHAPDPSKLFHKYYRLNRVSFQSGMGLGLWFSKLMMDALSGSLEARIEPPRVTFRLWIPCIP